MDLDIEQIKRWHWCVIGLIAGVLLSYVHRPATPLRVRSLSQSAFEADLARNSEQGRAALIDLVVYPARDGYQIVTGRELLSTGMAFQQSHYMPFIFRAPHPYDFDGHHGTQPDFSVQSRLAALAASSKNLQYEYAWWAAPRVTFSLWTGGSVFLLGGVWPTLIGILTGAGLGRKRLSESEYDLNRFGHDPESKPPVAPRESAMLDQAIAAALAEAQTTAKLKPATSAKPAVVSPPPVLQGALVEAPGAFEESDPAKSFGGAFYPTTAHPSKGLDD